MTDAVTKRSASARPLEAAAAMAPTRDKPSDVEIVAALTRGEPWAADALYDRVLPHVERALGGACDLPSWSSAVAAHVALDALRRQARERRLFRDELVPEPGRAHDP